jgi:hypothetical protein
MSPAFARRPWRALLASCRHHRWLLGVAFGYVAICAAIAADIGRFGALDFTMYDRLIPLAGAMLAVLACLRAVILLALARPARPIPFLVADARRYLSAERIAAAAPIFLTVPVFMAVCTSMKDLIPVLNPYHWDPALATLDRALHGGTDPWRLLQPVFGNAWATAALNALYHVWFLCILGGWFIPAFSTRRPRLRLRYFIATFLAWAGIGTFAAVALSSVGPAFYGHVVPGPNPFAPLMADLHRADAIIPVSALATQDWLWNLYARGHTALGSGISAMPSMHVASTLLFALLLRGWNRALGWLGFAFLGLIMIASVDLAWHYAIDGYAAIAMGLVAWYCAGWITDRMPEFAQAGPTPAARPLPA